MLIDSDTTVENTAHGDLPALIGKLAEVTAKAQIKLLTTVKHDADTLLTIAEVAQRLNISTYRAYELCRHGTLHSKKLGKSVRVTPSALADYVSRQGA